MAIFKKYLKSIDLFACLIVIFCCEGQSQTTVANFDKPTIDTSVFDKWISADVPIISNDANYAIFNIQNQPVRGKTMVVKSINSQWKREFVKGKMGVFTRDDKKAVLINSGDSLCIIALGSNNEEYIPSVNSFELVRKDNDEWLCYLTKTKDLVLKNLSSGQQKLYKQVRSYSFNRDASTLVLQMQSQPDNNLQVISWLDFDTNKSVEIWRGSNASNFLFDKSGKELAFIVTNKNDGKSIWFYKDGENNAKMIADNKSDGIDSTLEIDGIAYNEGFSNDGDKLFIYLAERTSLKTTQKEAMVDVWNYLDLRIQSMQKYLLNRPKRYEGCVFLKENKVSQMQFEPASFNIPQQWNDTAITSYSWGDNTERIWNNKSSWNSYLIFVESGVQLKLKISVDGISPTGRYIVGKGIDNKGNIYSYDRLSGKYQNLTSDIDGTGDILFDSDFKRAKTKNLELAGWLTNDQGVLLYDRHDIWAVYLKTPKAAKNITNGFGRKHHLKFTLLEIARRDTIRSESIVVQGFDYFNKNEGFYHVHLDKVGDPEFLFMGPYKFEVPYVSYNAEQLNAKHPVFLVKRESVTESPNYFLTSDFKTFKEVTGVYPEKHFNWIKSELHTWKSPQGKVLQGILYKPENFDSKKRYPVIMHYYQIVSNELNSYLRPTFLQDDVNEPYFVSNGYLVFEPDIYYTSGRTGESAKQSISSAAIYLSRFPFIDSKHIGIEGHSFGGYETNYVVTHTDLFSAAVSTSGTSDFISGYDNLAIQGRGAQNLYERGQNRMDVMLWRRPDLYILNSPVFFAHKVTTPLMLMSNQKDDAVPSFHGLELFMGLRRLGKRVWMLQYDNGDHSLSDKKDKIDLTVRMKQFFDHYLKDSACPRWMLYGIPAKEKGLDNGYDLVKIKDKNDKWLTPKEGGLLTDEEKKKVEALKHRKPVAVTIE